jgi:hypothetical protein
MIDFEIKKDSNRGYIVIRVNGSYEQHAHVSSMNGARLLINIIHKGMLPESDYLKTSCRRLLTDIEYSKLRRKKQRYVNVNKCVRRCG